MKVESIEKRAEEALTYLADTDEYAASLKYEALKAEAKYRSTVDALFLHEEGSVEQRKAKARAGAEDACMTFLEAQREFDAVKNRRDHEALVVEWLRSLNANRRQGA